ncbi:hypothetical protein RclHR1_03460016 [Rhizophagus clarus]|uniref:F-box domain-containing protein n=1 Tax=Rhizophagus clarus TaxID=94130 RepID=A0A2Z6RA78_9GLOM|nr:hypothetical protein RclHR1_03460016 [Rhizophagus clarus]
MLNLDRDILFQIFEKLQDDRNSLHNSLLVNVSWCEIIVPILWKNPWKCFSTHGKISRRNLQTHLLNDEKKKKLLLDVIISHLSDETSDTFGLTTKYKKPLFNYIGFCKHLNLGDLEGIINIMECKKLGVYDKIINLFINENTRITHLYIPHKFKHKLHLIPGAESCLLRLEYLQCSTLTEDDVLVGLAEISESIEELNLNIYGLQDNYYNVNNNGIIKLIQCQKKLNNVRFYYAGTNYPYMEINSNSFYKDLENSLIKHASNIQYFSTNKKPYPNFLSYFKNLKYLEMSDDYTLNTVHNQMIIKAIYENCPNVEYLEIPFNNNCILEFENLLVKCQYLDSLYLTIEEEDWE